LHHFNRDECCTHHSKVARINSNMSALYLVKIDKKTQKNYTLSPSSSAVLYLTVTLSDLDQFQQLLNFITRSEYRK